MLCNCKCHVASKWWFSAHVINIVANLEITALYWQLWASHLRFEINRPTTYLLACLKLAIKNSPILDSLRILGPSPTMYKKGTICSTFNLLIITTIWHKIHYSGVAHFHEIFETSLKLHPKKLISPKLQISQKWTLCQKCPFGQAYLITIFDCNN